MSISLSRFLQQQARFINMMNKAHLPASNFQIAESQMWALQHSERMNTDWIHNISPQVNFIQRNAELFDIYSKVDRLAFDTNLTVNTVIEAINNQRQLIDHFNNANGQYLANINKWHINISNLFNSQSLNLNDTIPDSFYSPLDVLTAELEFVSNYQDGHSDLPAEITVKGNTFIQERKMTWADLIVVLLTVWQVIFMHYSNYENSLQQEELIQLKEKQIELDEQKLKIAEEKLELEQKNYELQKRLEEKFDAFTETLESFITDQSNPIVED